MDRYLLKNIMIIILALVNVFLLGALAIRQSASYSARERTEEQLVALFAADGMTLDRDLISHKTPPQEMTLTRNAEQERSVAAFLLGESNLRSSQDGGVCRYSTVRGTVQFRSNGGFDAAGNLAGMEGEEACREFCSRFSYGEPVFRLDDTGTGTAGAAYRLEKLPVYNCTVTFTLDHGDLMAVSGTLLSQEGAAATGGEDRTPLSAAAALMAFQQLRRESYAVVSAITDVTLCYELQSTIDTVVPAWCIATDTGNYYVNCLTGLVTSG